MPFRYILTALLALLTPAAAAQSLSLTDATVTIPGDTRFTLANETGAPVVLDSLAMRYQGTVGEMVHLWFVETVAGAPAFDCTFSGITVPAESKCFGAPALVPAGATVEVGVGFDACAICRTGEAPASGGTPIDTLLVYSGGLEVPQRVVFDGSNFVSLGDAPEAGGLALRVGPNPSAGVVRVSLTPGALAASVEAVVYDALGRRMALVHDGPLAPGTSSFRLDTSGWPAGAYVIRASAGAGSTLARLTVAR